MQTLLHKKKPQTKKIDMNAIKKHFKTNWVLHLMTLPGVICLVLFSYLPMFGIVMAFQDYKINKGIFKSKFIGLDNFKFLFASNDAWIITRNTILYNLVFILVGTACAVALSLMISEMYYKKTSKVLQTIFVMPNFLSISVIAIIVYAFLSLNNGFINSVLLKLGKDPVSWYTTPKIWPGLLIFVNLWKSVGYSAIVYLAGISGISNEYYEAAMIDGATKWQQIKYITLPGLRFVVTIQLIMAVGGIFRGDMGLFYTVTMNNGALYPVTDIIDTYVYRALTTINNTGMATAAGLYQSVVGVILIILANHIVRKIDEDSALF